MGSAGDRIKTAVITGKHPFDVPAFHAAFRSMPEIDFYPQHMEEFAADFGQRRADYDALLFFNFHQETPDDETARAALESLGDSEQGIVILHHGLLAYPQWPLWGDLVGISDRSFDVHMDHKLKIQVANLEHPVTQGLSDWEMLDETYVVAEPDADSEVLLYSEDPKSMRSIGWTRRYKNARVFCFQSGHNHHAYANESFRRVISRGLQWAAGRI
ncbi:MAG: ThuA domain-containing protein [Chloroflexi bacterium]|nr:ThuA domain-containing protein [Chloroflexota bacterium]